jgi:hypothetical protein
MRSSPQQPLLNNTTEFHNDYISTQSQALASKLCGHMGIDGALQVSTENQWHGVVAALMEIKGRKTRHP